MWTYNETLFPALQHHGINGQRWGVRRFQNEDGTYTERGLQRLRSKRNGSFTSAVDKVNSEISNLPKAVHKQTADVNAVMSRSGLNRKDAEKCIELAESMYDRASSAEPAITSSIVGVVSGIKGAGMYGLQHRLKQPTSIAGKIGSDALEDDVSFEEAASGLKDAVRYTVVSNENSFVSTYNKVKSGLEANGYTEERCKNYFEQYREGLVSHKAVQCVYTDASGQRFELQFQTPESQAAKELKLPLYEERRSSTVSDQRAKELEQQMKDLAEQVPYPYGISQIKSHSGNAAAHSFIGEVKMWTYNETRYPDFLMHWRTKGSRNGVRLYQYPDGSLTPLGREHYGIGPARKGYTVIGKSSSGSGESDGGNSGNSGKWFKQNIKAGKDKAPVSPAEKTAKESQRMVDETRGIAQAVRRIKQRNAQTEDLSEISDAELKARINRLNMERQYATLTTEETGQGLETVADILAIVGGTVAIVGGVVTTVATIKNM